VDKRPRYLDDVLFSIFLVMKLEDALIVVSLAITSLGTIFKLLLFTISFGTCEDLTNDALLEESETT
jgi:hypothetical protein